MKGNYYCYIFQKRINQCYNQFNAGSNKKNTKNYEHDLISMEILRDGTLSDTYS